MKKTLTILISAVLVVTSLSSLGLAKNTRQPTNDDFASALPIGELPFTTTANTIGSSLEQGEVQPTCKAIRSSVWYILSGTEATTVVAQLSSAFPAAVAVYEQTPEALVETACTFDTASAETEFDLEADKTYFMQLGATGSKQGKADLSLAPSVWKEVSLFDQTFTRESDELHVPLLSVKGSPRQSNPSMYDVSVQISEQVPVTVGILTFGLVTEKIEQELVRIPASTTEVSLEITGRYDSSQYTCAADDGNETCYASVPLKDLNWLTGDGGSRAELLVSIRAERNGTVLLERTQAVPYAGHALGLLP